MGDVEGGQVALDDTTTETVFDQVRDAPEEALPGSLVQTYVAGVGVQDAQVALGVVRFVPLVTTLGNLAQQAGRLDLAGPVRDLVRPRKPSTVFWLDDLRRLALVDFLRGLEEAPARIAVNVLVPEQGDGPAGPERLGDLRVCNRGIQPVKGRRRDHQVEGPRGGVQPSKSAVSTSACG